MLQEKGFEMFTRNGAHDVGGIAGLGSIPVESDEPVWHATWEGRVLGATLAAVTTGMLVPPTHRAVIEALHPVTYLSMDYYELWLYALEQCAVKTGVLTQQDIEARVADTLRFPDAPMPQDHHPDIVDNVNALITHGVPAGPERLAQPPRFASGDTVRTKRIELHAPGRPHTRIPGYAQNRVGVVEIVHSPMLLEDKLVASGEVVFEYVYAVRLRAHDVWSDAAQQDTIVIDLWESYLEDEALPSAADLQENEVQA